MAILRFYVIGLYLLLCLVVSQLASAETTPKYFTSIIEGSRTENYMDGVFRLWLPDNPNPIKGILTIILGGNMNGSCLVEDASWQKTASDFNFALLTINFDNWGVADDWANTRGGSGQALVQALSHLASAAKHPEIDKVPLAIIGVSTGGEFAYSWTAYCPHRVSCFVTLKGGLHSLTYDQGPASVPALLVTATEDNAYRIKNINDLFNLYRARNAPWTLLVEPNAGHACDKTAVILAPYLQSLFSSNSLTNEQSSQHYGSAVIANNRNLNLITNLTSTVSLSETSFIPSLDFYQVWRRFQQGDLDQRSTLTLKSKLADFSVLASDKAVAFPPYVRDTASRPERVLSIENRPLNSAQCDISFIDPEHVWKISLLEVDDNRSTYRVEFIPDKNIPLGEFLGVLKVRYFSEGQLLPIPLNIPAIVRIEGDVAALPGSIYLGGVKPSTEIKKQLIISSTKGIDPRVLGLDCSDQMPLSYTVLSSIDGVTKLNLNFMGQDLLRRKPFNLLIRLKTNHEWFIRVPVIWYPSTDSESLPIHSVSNSPKTSTYTKDG